MENCKFHKEKEAVSRCKVCGAALCDECEKVHQKYHACPKCVKGQLTFELSNYKQGLIYIFLALACLVADLALLITKIIMSKGEMSAILIVSIVFFVLFAPFCIWLLVDRILKIKKLSNLLKNVEEVPADDKQDKKIAEKFEEAKKEENHSDEQK